MTTNSKETQTPIEEEEEGQWKYLPDNILFNILRHFSTKPDLCRFRSICKSWRSFATSIESSHLPPLILRPLIVPRILDPNSCSFSIFPTFLYIFSPNLAHHNIYKNHRWLTKVEVEVSGNNIDYTNNKWLHYNPLKDPEPFPNSFPRVFGNVIDLLGFRNFEVGRSYRIQWGCDGKPSHSCYILSKVAVLIKDKIYVLGMNIDGDIFVWNYGDEDWNYIETEEDEYLDCFDDVICYDGKFYAVGHTGRLIMLDLTEAGLEITEVISSAQMCNPSQDKYLVEFNLRLYLVTKMVYNREWFPNPRRLPLFVDVDVDGDDGDTVYVHEEKDGSSVGKSVEFKVYVLNEREKSWEKVDSLGNKVFFATCDSIFLASAEDLGWSKGGCIFFYGDDDEANERVENVSLYSLEDDAVVKLDLPVDHRTWIFLPHSSWFAKYRSP